MTEQAETRFARVGDVHIAYQVVGRPNVSTGARGAITLAGVPDEERI